MENKIVKHWIEQHFTYIEKRQSKINFSSGLWSLWPAAPSWQPVQCDWPMLSHVRLQWKEPWPFSSGVWNAESWGEPEGHGHTGLSRTRAFALQEQGRVLPPRVLRPAQAGGHCWVTQGCGGCEVRGCLPDLCGPVGLVVTRFFFISFCREFSYDHGFGESPQRSSNTMTSCPQVPKSVIHRVVLALWETMLCFKTNP